MSDYYDYGYDSKPEPQKPPEPPRQRERPEAREQPREEVRAQDLLVDQDARMWAVFCHLGAFGWLMLPIVGNIVAPMVIWLVQREKMPFVDYHGRIVLNFQISMTILFLCSLPLTCFFIGYLLLVAIPLYTLIHVIRGAMAASQGEYFHYPRIFEFIPS